MTVHVWIRSTLDWADEDGFRAQLPPEMAPRVELWDATLTLPYRLFRAELRRIAALNVMNALLMVLSAVFTMVLPRRMADAARPPAQIG